MSTHTSAARPASEKAIHRMRFDKETGRWCIGDHELHCGDCFDIFSDNESAPPVEVRIEHCSGGWYLISPYGVLQPSTRRASL